jgi:hypothetical protein
MNDLHDLTVLRVTLDEPTHPHPEVQPIELERTQQRSTLGRHCQQLAVALVTQLLEWGARHLDVDVDTCASGAGVQGNRR